MKLNLDIFIKKTILLITVILLSSFIVFETNHYISIILLVETSIFFLLDCIDNGYKIRFRIGLFHLWGALFALFCIFSSFWAINFQIAFSKGLTIVQILICMEIIYNYYCKKDNYKLLLSSIEYSGYLLASYTVFYYGINDIKNILLTASRIDNSFANMNAIGMACAISMVICVYSFIYEKKGNIIKLPVVILMIIVITVSGSRTALIGFIFGIFCLFLFRFASRSAIKTVLKWSIICAFFVGLLSLVLTLEIFDSLNHRMEGLIALLIGTGTVDQSAWLRQQFIKIGIEQFLETPLVGIGIDNARFLLMQHFGYTTYLHNNYVEILASGGLTGTCLFYSIYVYIFKKLKMGWSKHVSESKAVFAIVSAILIMDFGNISYYSKTIYFYIMTCCIIANSILKVKRDEE